MVAAHSGRVATPGRASTGVHTSQAPRIRDTGQHRDSTVGLVNNRFDDFLPFFPVKERKLSARSQRKQPVDSSINQEIHESSRSLRVDLLVVSYCCGHRCYDPFQLFHSQSVDLSLETCLRLLEKSTSGGAQSSRMGTATTLEGAPSPSCNFMGMHIIRILLPRNSFSALLRDSMMKIPFARRVLCTTGSGALNFSTLRKST